MSPLEQREGRSLWVMRGDGCRGCARVRVCMCVCGVWEVKVSGVGHWMRGWMLEWRDGSMSWVKHGNMDTELL